MTLMSNPLAIAADLEQEDKQKHMAVSTSIAALSYASLRTAQVNKFVSASLSFVLTLGIGHLKEKSDPFYDNQDMQANLVGASLGLILPLRFQF